MTIARFFAFLTVLVSFAAGAQVIAPSAEEISFQYSAEFVMTVDGGTEGEQAANHAQYMFGVMHSPSVVSEFGLDPELVEGIGGPNLPLTIKVNRVGQDADGRAVISYQAFGRMLLHKKAAKAVIRASELVLHLPYDSSRVYLKKCTDDHYPSFGDYWYFWDPYRAGCEKLLEPAATREVRIKIAKITTQPKETAPNLERLQGDNGNGDLMRIYVLNGFNENSSVSADEGRQNFEQLREIFAVRGFEIVNVNRTPRIPRNLYKKRLEKDGKIIEVEVIHQLANTDIAADAITFARSFKEAIRDGDMIIYLGHSGLGGNLDIPWLNAKLEERGEGGIEFPKNKYQVFFFDSCSSYSYYLSRFRELKPKGKIDIISYGLSSYFSTSTLVFEVLMEKFLRPGQAAKWETILRAMEEPLDGASYLLNVGGV